MGLLCLASSLKQENHHPHIIDLNLLFTKKKFPSNYFKRTAKEIMGSNPQVLGFSVMCLTLPTILLLAKECKKIDPKVPIILGGPEVTFDDVELLKAFVQIDIIVRGEGDVTTGEVLAALEKNESLAEILGITYRNNSRVSKNPDRPLIKDLNTLVFPDFSLIPHLKKYRAAEIEAGRGCPHQCTFCSNCRMWKRTFRIKSAERLAQEMKRIQEIYKEKEDFLVMIMHDHFLVSRKIVEGFFDLISNDNFQWICFSRLDALDGDIIKKLKKSGCRRIFIGIESGSPGMQRKIKKNLPLSKLPQILKLLTENGIQTSLSYIIGFPGEKTAQINQTLYSILQSKLYSFAPVIQVFPFLYLKGSELYVNAKSQFKQADLWQTDKLQTLTKLPEEVALINKYLHIFPTFYYKRESNYQFRFLEKICDLFVFLSESFPLTTLLLMKHLSMTPMQLGKKTIAVFDSSKAGWARIIKSKPYTNYYFPYVKTFIDGISSQLIKEVFMHEDLFFKTSFKQSQKAKKIRSVRLNSRPKLIKGVKIKEYAYDILGITDYLRGKKREHIPKSKCYVLYVPGEMMEAYSITPFLYQLLINSNGKQTINEIVNLFSVNSKKIKQDILNTFKSFQKQGIISCI
ncbi:MAG: B12-binding domain-containing radical SAM protein [Candidatus Margulisbacteria bacterium]|nr:B12-binding domain-containing radical SAM protein [Candidatus Margulisiibacteriota bacterium]MBU1021083.1 B12-binding domain-containing radical SAM protein [Candidatus Margulisiibacteriota bacterium]MBU1729892.1 B12-binding domain-containing radical SAM protein [Candidatus Margulisiibacteriota bacterium]MBU1955222.1 B12-binding domain-containing radical SAM protein [Candidatus Margulisiibacteriota bacterium]